MSRRSLVLLAASAVLLLAVIGLMVSRSSTPDCFDRDSATTHLDKATEYLDAMETQANAGDLEGVLANNRALAEEAHLIAIDVAADPELSAHIEVAADHFDASTEAMESGDFDSAAQEMRDGGEVMTLAASLLESSSVPKC